MLQPTYANQFDEFEYLRGLSGAFVLFLNSSSGLPADTMAATMAQITAVEVASGTRYPTRPAFNPAAATLNATKKRYELTLTIVIPTDTATFTFDRVAIITGGTSARGNTTGTIRYLEDTVTPVTIAANQPGSYQITLYSGGSTPPTDYTA